MENNVFKLLNVHTNSLQNSEFKKHLVLYKHLTIVVHFWFS